jgi:hypothetical protein
MEDKIAELRKMLGDSFNPSRHTNFLLEKYLSARGGNVSNAYEMLLKADKWREEMNIPDLIENFRYKESKIMSEMFPRYFHKCDKLGRPIWFMEFEKLDGYQFFQNTSEEMFIKDHIRRAERQSFYYCKVATDFDPRANYKMLVVIDLKGARLTQFYKFSETIYNYFGILMSYFPETVGKAFIINAPLLFTAIWGLFKQLADQRLIDKFSIVGSNYRDELYKYVESENLPARYGGSCVCGSCGSKDLGPWNDGTVSNEIDSYWDFESRDQ